MSVIEVTTFRLADSDAEAAFLAADRAVQAASAPRKGFLRRTTAKGESGTWLVLSLWASATDADASAATPFEEAASRSFPTLVEATSSETQRFRTLD